MDKEKYKNRDLIEYGRELGKAEAYKYAFDKLIEVAKEQNKTTTNETYFDNSDEKFEEDLEE